MVMSALPRRPDVCGANQAALGHTRTFAPHQRMWALPPNADIRQRDWNVRLESNAIAVGRDIRTLVTLCHLLGKMAEHCPARLVVHLGLELVLVFERNRALRRRACADLVYEPL